MEEYREFIQLFVELWHKGLQNPALTQAQTLEWLLEGYARTTYGQQLRRLRACRTWPTIHPASLRPTAAPFPSSPTTRVKPWIDRVIAGEVEALLPEPPVAWAMTRGTTRGTPKRIPITETDLGIRVAAARGLLNHLLRTDQLDAIEGYSLNLNYPSVVGTMEVAGQQVPYGFSSGIYVRHAAAGHPRRDPAAPGRDRCPGRGQHARRLEASLRDDLPAHQRRAHHHVRRGLPLHHRVRTLPPAPATRCCPRNLWHMRVIAATSVPGIHTKYEPALRALYGPVDVVEMYIATEGTFAQQLDERRLLVPNYDLYVFEVLLESGTVKMLHEMRPGEYGSLIVSTPVLPRYRIGDLVRAFDPPYFRCIGREGRWTKWSLLAGRRPLPGLWSRLMAAADDAFWGSSTPTADF